MTHYAGLGVGRLHSYFVLGGINWYNFYEEKLGKIYLNYYTHTL